MTDAVTELPGHAAFLAAERLAPGPTSRDEATTEGWSRHFAALGLAACVAFYDALPLLGSKPLPGSRPELGYFAMVSASATAATVALTAAREDVTGLIWDLTPEAGALNGEWVEWLTETLDRLGVNPADIDHRLAAADFASTSRAEEVA
jgi:hypothetical protein